MMWFIFDINKVEIYEFCQYNNFKVKYKKFQIFVC